MTSEGSASRRARRWRGGTSVVTVSASLTTIAEDNLFERAARFRFEGFTDADVAAAAWDANRSASWFKRVYGDEHPAPPDHPYRRWYRSVMDVDPVPVWRALEVPALDRSSPVARSMAVAEGLRVSGKDVEVVSFAGADHSLQRSGREAIAEQLMAWLKRRL